MSEDNKSDENLAGVVFSWLPTSDWSSFNPITQYYGVCFRADGQLLLARKPGRQWSLPGGSPEAGESPETTLRRELLEEANVTVGEAWPLGLQRVAEPPRPGQTTGRVHYQARFVCRLREQLPRRPDPDTGLVWELKFVPPAEANVWVRWGAVGERLFADAVDLYSRKSGGANFDNVRANP